MPPLTDAGRRLVAETAARHGLSKDTVAAMLAALAAGGGTQAQFSIPELGGMGQWSSGGMTMVGDMFNDGLKARVNALCADLSAALAADTLFAAAPSRQSQSQSQSQGGGDGTAPAATSFFRPDPARAAWPSEYGAPASEGTQNDLRYAWFPAHDRLAIAQAGRITVYDTGDHRISGFGQAQGGGQSLTFTSQRGVVPLAALPVVSGMDGGSARSAGTGTGTGDAPAKPPESGQAPEPAAQRPAPPHGDASLSDEQIFSRLERLGDLRDRGIIDEAEFAAKKAELLARL